MVTVVLASKSPARLTTLRNAGIEPIVCVSKVDEDKFVNSLPPQNQTPSHLVCALSEAKTVDVAQSVVNQLNSSQPSKAFVYGSLTPPSDLIQLIVIGCDSMLEIGGRLVGKPGTPNVARQRIRQMRGKDAVLWTGHCAVLLEQKGKHNDSCRWHSSTPITEAASTVIHFGEISDKEVDAYVATGEPLNVAGSFTIDGLGGPFVNGVTGDPHSVVGLSLPLMRKIVAQFGVCWTELWNKPPKTNSAGSTQTGKLNP